MLHPLNSHVASLLRKVSADVVMPRFRNLRDHDIAEKSPGEVVTIADREAEVRLSDGLTALDGTARILGEEACSEDPKLLTGLERGRCWIIDPIDGTSNFAAGQHPFGMIIALVEDGVAQAGWLYDPVNDRMCHASFGQGAFIDEKRVTSRGSGAVKPIAALATQFMTQEDRDLHHARSERAFHTVPIPRCAAEHYPRLCLGQNDIAMFQRTLPWDHVAGALFLTEAGGRVARWDGTPYHVGENGAGILAAATSALWDIGAAVLFHRSDDREDSPPPAYQREGSAAS